jgi:uncharacterized protein
VIEITLAEARSIAIAAQGLNLTSDEPAAASQVLHSLGCIQLDTINVVRRSHELVLLARSVDSSEAAAVLQPGVDRTLFEYWAHAACLIPLRSWPLFTFRRRHLLRHGWRGPNVDPAAVDYVRKAVADLGQATISELGGAQGSGWERSAPAKWAAEWLLATGEFACVSRQGWKRIYQNSTGIIPNDLRDAEPSDEDCVAGLIDIALKALGIGTIDDIADYFRLPKEVVADHLNNNDKLEQISVRGWGEPAWAFPDSLVVSQQSEPTCTPLSPFDSLIWHRPRTQRLFGVDYPLEAYKPATARQCGYFGMPVLSGNTIVGRIAVRSSRGITRLEGYQLVADQDPDHLHQAVHTAAAWANATNVIAEPLCGSPGPHRSSCAAQ